MIFIKNNKVRLEKSSIKVSSELKLT